jgi:long-chain acyl-CoA synthetase
MRARESEWLSTGDLATKNDAGELKFLGRKGDVIVTAAGMNVYPGDLEEAMSREAGVRGCAVVGCETPHGSEPVAVVVFEGGESELAATVSRVNEGLAEYQRIRRVLRWPEMQLPYTATGKLLRRKVAAWACASVAGKDVAGTSTDGLLALIAEASGETAGDVGDEARLSEDLHLDSLGRVQLQSLLEQRMGLELDEEAMSSVRTVGELRGLLHMPALGSAVREGARPEAVEDDVYPTWPWMWPVQLLRVAFVEVVLRPVVWLIAAPKVTRAGEIGEGPLLVIANHVTAYDGALVLFALPGRLRRRIAAAMSGEMLMDYRKARGQGSAWTKALGPVAYLLLTALFNVFPLPRLRGFRRSFAHAGEAMDRGYSVMIFPEGRRSRSGVMQAFRPGIGLLAKESGVKVLPVMLTGLGSGGGRWPRSRKIEVRVGEPIALDETKEAAEITLTLERAVRALMEKRGDAGLV